MIRHQRQTSLVRFYTGPTEDPFAPYEAICTLVWESPEVVWIGGMHGTIGRRHLRELAQFLADHGVETAKAHRASTRRLPLGQIVGDHIEISVRDYLTRSTERGDPR